MFDSDGTFTESTWKQNGKTWSATTKGVLADGKRATAVYNYTPVDDNTILFSSTNRDVAGQDAAEHPRSQNGPPRGGPVTPGPDPGGITYAA